MWPQTRKITSDLLGGLMKRIPYSGVPERFPSCPFLLKDKCFRRGPVTDCLLTVAWREHPNPQSPSTALGLGSVEFLVPQTLLNVNGRGLEVDVPPFQPKDFRDP